MKRRELLITGLAFAIGASVAGVATYQLKTGPLNHDGDLERSLIAMVRPDGAALADMFPELNNYESTIAELRNRGLVEQGNLNMSALDDYRAVDEVMEFSGWQYLETELLLFHAAYQLAGQHLNIAQGSNSIPFDQFDVTEGIDAAGEPIASYRIQAPSDYASLAACIELCEDEERCLNITLAKPAHPIEAKRNMCWLTTDEVTRSPSPFYYTARKK